MTNYPRSVTSCDGGSATGKQSSHGHTGISNVLNIIIMTSATLSVLRFADENRPYGEVSIHDTR